MKKNFFLVVCAVAIALLITPVYSKGIMSPELSKAIKLYKAGNYTECYAALNTIIKRDSSNALAYYYLAITDAQIGKKDEAIENYDKALALAEKGINIYRYANKGKTCLTDPEKCKEENMPDPDEEFVKHGSGFSDTVKSEYEKLRIENMMREMNRSNDLEPQKFKKYKDFSSMNDSDVPTNDEIVAAIRTLQRAGLSDIMSNNYNLSLLNANSENQRGDMFNMYDSAGMNPQLIQALFTNSKTLGF